MVLLDPHRLRVLAAALVVVLAGAAGWLALAGREPATTVDSHTDLVIALPPPIAPAQLAFDALRVDGLATRTDVQPSSPPRAPLIRTMAIPQFHGVGDEQHRVYRDRPWDFFPQAIVVHGTGGGAPGSGFDSVEQLQRFFARAGARASSHYGIDRDGTILRFVRDEEAAFHVATNGWNDLSIGIELVNDNSGSDPFPRSQQQALTQLTRWLAVRYDIPAEAVVRHRDVQPEDRSDPAGNFPWAQWKRLLVRADRGERA